MSCKAIDVLRFGLAVAAAAVPAMLAVPFPAQGAQAPAAGPVRTIQVGQTLDGSLEPGDPSESRYHDYRLRLEVGDAVQIDLESAEFDTFLELRRPGQSEPLDSNDDRGDSLNSRLVFTAAEADDYILRAARLFSGSGAYQLKVARQQSVPRAALAVGTTGGDFDDTAPLLPGAAGTPLRHRLYEFRGAPQERVQLDLTSDALTPRLEVLGADGQVLVTGTGTGNRHNARLIFVVPRDTTYTVRASAPASQSGHFDLAFRKGPAAAPVAAVELRGGSRVVGRFSFDSTAEFLGTSQIRYFYRDFTLPVRRGEVLTLDLESRDFDPLLEVGIVSPVGFALARRDDDGGDGLNARLVLRPNSVGELTVRARSVRSQVGCFTLRVTQAGQRAPARGPAAAQPVAPPAAAAPQECPAAAAAPATP